MRDRFSMLGVQDSPQPPRRSTATLRPEAEYFIASQARGKFHRPGCEWAACIAEPNVRFFDEREEAIAAGYNPCGTCCA